jgi:hypothetical protein
LALLGHIELRAGDETQAHSKFTEALRRFADANRQTGIIYSIDGLASLAVRQKQSERVVRLLAWTDATRAAMGDYQRPPVEQADVDRHLALARAQLDEAAFEASWAEGRAMTMEQAIEYALEKSDG